MSGEALALLNHPLNTALQITISLLMISCVIIKDRIYSSSVIPFSIINRVHRLVSHHQLMNISKSVKSNYSEDKLLKKPKEIPMNSYKNHEPSRMYHPVDHHIGNDRFKRVCLKNCIKISDFVKI